MVSRRHFCLLAAAPPARSSQDDIQRADDRILRGEETDRPAFTLWYHFLDSDQPGERHAELTLGFHRRIGTDLVK